MAFKKLVLPLCAAISIGMSACSYDDTDTPDADTGRVVGVGGQVTKFAVSKGSIVDLRAVNVPAGANPQLTYPNGFFGYSVTDLAAGDTVTVEVQLPSGSNPDVVVKCSNDTTCETLAPQVANISGNRIALTLTDGGTGDADGQANGVIVDPFGPAVSPATPTPAPTATPTPSATATPTSAPTATPTGAPTATPTATPTGTPTTTPTPTAAPTATPTAVPTATPTPGSSTAASCINPAIEVIGTRLQQVFRSTDGDSGAVVTTTSDSVVMRNTTFNGNDATEAESDVEARSSVPQGNSDSNTLTYTKLLNNTTLRAFGTVTEATASGFSSTITTKINPYLESRYNLSAGESYSQTYAVEVSGTAAGFPIPATNTTTTLKRTYIGREQVTVPAGTFEACKFTDEATINGATSTTTTWNSVSKGIFLKSASGNDSNVLVSASINGVAVTGD